MFPELADSYLDSHPGEGLTFKPAHLNRELKVKFNVDMTLCIMDMIHRALCVMDMIQSYWKSISVGRNNLEIDGTRNQCVGKLFP